MLPGKVLMDYEMFGTEAEARAFVKGLEIARDTIDDDHIWWHEPQQLAEGEWQVNYGMNY